MNGRLEARRDKCDARGAQGGGVRVRTACVACEWSVAQRFLATLPQPLAAVLKPRRGSSSLRVGLARSELHARALFTDILANPSSLDDESDDASVLLQEFLGGAEAEEWVVDTISRDGEHRIATLWRYDKGEANDAPFVYFGQEPMGSGSVQAQRIAAYARDVLDALAWRWGPAHLEVMWMGESRGPVLVEANMGRWDSSDTKLITDVCFGANVYDAAFAALLDRRGDAWARVPPMPPAQLPCAGQLVELVSYASGALVRVRHREALDAMESVMRVSLKYEEAGELVRRTIDLNSFAGEVVLLHADPAVVAADYAALRALQPTLFDVDDSAGDAAAAAAQGWRPRPRTTGSPVTHPRQRRGCDTLGSGDGSPRAWRGGARRGGGRDGWEVGRGDLLPLSTCGGRGAQRALTLCRSRLRRGEPIRRRGCPFSGRRGAGFRNVARAAARIAAATGGPDCQE